MRVHTTVALECVLANLDSILTVLVSDTAHPTNSGGLLWGGYGGCEKGMPQYQQRIKEARKGGSAHIQSL